MAGLARGEGQGGDRPHGGPSDGARVGIHTGRNVDRNDRLCRRIHARNQLGCNSVEIARNTGSEQRIDDDVRLPEFGGSG
jgi:hypothetical protein